MENFFPAGNFIEFDDSALRVGATRESIGETEALVAMPRLAIGKDQQLQGLTHDVDSGKEQPSALT